MMHFLALITMMSVTFLNVASAAPKRGNSLSAKAAESARENALMIELTGKDDAVMSDVELYSEIVAAYQASDEIGLKSRLQKFLARHSQSSFADNALYLAGRQALDNKNYAEALKFFGRIVNEYPRSNRVVSAQFAKAMAYKKMNLEPQARKVFKEIVSKYPGSPESFRADSEIRLLN